MFQSAVEIRHKMLKTAKWQRMDMERKSLILSGFFVF
jgi:hypothetical protein